MKHEPQREPSAGRPPSLHWDGDAGKRHVDAETIQKLASTLARPVNLGIALGVVAVIASILIGLAAYGAGRETVVRQLEASNMRLARVIAAEAARMDSLNVDVRIARIDELWRASDGRTPGSYVCVLSREGVLVYHSSRPDLVGTDASEVGIDQLAEGAPATVGSLLAEGKSWSGENVNLFGDRQIAAYAFESDLDGAVVVHVPTASLDREIRAAAMPWALGMTAIALVVFPAALGLLILGFRRSRAQVLRAFEDQQKLRQELVQAQRMEAIGQLAGGIAHDFNNLMTAMLGFTETVIARFDADVGLRSEAEALRTSVSNASGMTRQLLAFSRRQPLRPEAFDVHDVLTRASELLRHLIGEDIDLTIDLCCTHPWVLADAGQIEQVLFNLAVNARDAMPHGGKLTIESADLVIERGEGGRQDDLTPGRYVSIAVSDTGLGMDSETARRAFEPFFSTKAPGKGTGLGLSSVYGIVRQSGGSVHLDSRPGGGTTVTLCLPQVPAGHVKRESLESRSGSSRDAGQALVAEDDAAVRGIIVRTLEDAGYRVLEAADGRTATRLIESGGPRVDLLVADIVLPGPDGMSLARAARAANAECAVLLISGYPQSGALEAVAGARFLPKPFAPSRLLEVLDRAVDPAPARKRAFTG